MTAASVAVVGDGMNSSVIAPNEAPRRLADLPTNSDRVALPPSSRPVALSRHEVQP